ncbi:MAG TPA: RluA family pseudouridine synthase [Terriglobales bacterium]|jgi:23S rRNA pseudouridine1911/1915/1917 synthase
MDERLDRSLGPHLPGWSRMRVQALIRSGGVSVNGAVQTRPSTLVEPADILETRVEAAPSPASTLEPEAIPLTVLYEDDDLAVLDKPSGLVVHPGAGRPTGTLVHALLARYGTLSAGGRGNTARPGIVHRLDRDTSGVMVVARNDFAHQSLSEQFQTRGIEKRYRALAHGLFKEDHGEIELPVGRDRLRRIKMTTRRPPTHSRPAHTTYRVLAAWPAPAATHPTLRAASSYSALELELHTGRTHQIRVHLSALGHPVVGDRLYGAPVTLAGPGVLAGERPPRVLLHAATLAFTHPRSGERMAFTAPLPADMAEWEARLRAAAAH